nr:Zinc iron permease domain containing protein [Haemonchus contortus]
MPTKHLLNDESLKSIQWPVKPQKEHLNTAAPSEATGKGLPERIGAMTAWLQVALAVVMFLTTAIAGFIPIKLLRFLNKTQGDNKKRGRWLSLLSCFSGGVFMGTCFLDIIPHINENYEDFKVLSGTNFEFPLPQFFTCVGFFLVYLIEEICIKVFAMKHDHSSAVEVEKPVQKDTLNLRNTQALLGLMDDYELKPTGLPTNRFSLVMEETANYAVAESSEGSLLKSLTFAVAMSFHSILEGFALGVQNTTARIVTLFISLILHKGVEAFSVGLQISKGNSNKLKAVIATILIYAMMTPLGSGLGTLLQMSNISRLHKDGAVLILESLAAGTFIYVTFLEVLAHEKDNEHNSLKQLLAIFIGFAVIAALQFAFGDHGHDGGHEGGHVHTLPLGFTTTPFVPH